MFKKTINKQALVLEKKINFVKKKVLLLAYSIMYTKVYLSDNWYDFRCLDAFDFWNVESKVGGIRAKYYNK